MASLRIRRRLIDTYPSVVAAEPAVEAVAELAEEARWVF
jgi:hypothetical protein